MGCATSGAVVAIALDAMRLVLRGKTVPLLVGVGLALGLFVRVTQTNADHQHAAMMATILPTDDPGLLVAGLLEWLFSASLVFAVVVALAFAAEERRSGFLWQVAIRPTGRIAYATGRVVGVSAGVALGTLLLGAMAVIGTWTSPFGLPSLRHDVVAEQIVLSDGSVESVLAPDEARLLTEGRSARFVFRDAQARQATVSVLPVRVAGASFSGLVDLDVAWVREGGDAQSLTFQGLRPRRPLMLELGDDSGGAKLTLELKSRASGCALEIDRETVVLDGGQAPFAQEAAIVLLLCVLAGMVMCSLALFLGLALSPGPAGLAAGFVWLVAQGRPAVLDIVAGMGVEKAHSHAPHSDLHGGEASAVVEATRDVLTSAFRLVPDLAAFNGGEYLSALRAVPAGTVESAVGAAALCVLAAVFLVTATVPLVER